MEERQTGHSFSDENTLGVELLDIEEALRFDKLEVGALKQNISKAINIFYEMEQVYPATDKQLTFLLRKLLDCMGIAFSRLFEMNDKAARQLKQKGIGTNFQPSEQLDSGRQIDMRDKQTIRPLGGCIIADQVRGIQELHVPLPCQRCLNNMLKPPPQVKEEEEQKWDVEEQARKLLSIGPKSVSTSTFVSMIEAHMNSFKQKPSNSFDSSLECSLTSILRFFSDCEKDATIFINKKAMEVQISCDTSYEVGSELQNIRKDKSNGKETALKLLAKLAERNRANIAKVLETYRLEKQEQEQKLRTQTMQKRYKFCNQGTQTQETDNIKALQQQMEEQTIHIHALLTQQTKQQEEMDELRKLAEVERAHSRKNSSAVHDLRLQLDTYRENVKPMQDYIDTLTDDFNKLQEQMQENIRILNEEKLEEMMEGGDIPQEIKAKMREVLKSLVEKVTNGEALKAVKKRKPFRFRIGLLKAMEREDLNESFIKEITELKNKRTHKAVVRESTLEQQYESSESEFTSRQQTRSQSETNQLIEATLPASKAPKQSLQEAAAHESHRTSLRQSLAVVAEVSEAAPNRPLIKKLSKVIDDEQLSRKSLNMVAATSVDIGFKVPTVASLSSTKKITTGTQYFIEMEKSKMRQQSVLQTVSPSVNFPEAKIRPSEENTHNCTIVSFATSMQNTERQQSLNSNDHIKTYLDNSKICLISKHSCHHASVQTTTISSIDAQAQTADSEFSSTISRYRLPTVQQTVKDKTVYKVRNTEVYRRMDSVNNHGRLLPSVNTSIDNSKKKYPNRSVLTTMHTNSSVGHISCTEANEETYVNKTLGVEECENRRSVGKTRAFHSSIHTDNTTQSAQTQHAATRVSVLDSIASQRFESIEELQMEAGYQDPRNQAEIRQSVRAQKQKKQNELFLKSSARISQEEIMKESLKESTFKHFMKDSQFEECINELMHSLQGAVQPYTFSTRKDFKVFLHEQEQLHAMQCGGGRMCEHLSRFLQRMRQLIEKYNSRRPLKLPLHKISKIPSGKEN